MNHRSPSVLHRVRPGRAAATVPAVPAAAAARAATRARAAAAAAATVAAAVAAGTTAVLVASLLLSCADDTPGGGPGLQDLSRDARARADRSREATGRDAAWSADRALSAEGLSGKGNPESVGFGKRKTITIDGKNTGGEWGADTLLILDPAADDARFLGTNWCAHEAPWDYVALHAAWDDTNLYVGIQLVNVTDVLDPVNLGSSEGSQIQGMDLIQFVAFDTVAGQGYSTGGDMWGKSQEFVGEDRPDFQLYFHSNFSQEGLYLGKWNGTKLVQITNAKQSPGLKGAGGEFFVGQTLLGVDPKADDTSPGNYGKPSIDYIKDKNHDTKYDTFFELQIPLALLEISATTLDKGMIGLFAANGDGSAVDSVPNDPATSSTPGVSNSNSPLEWDMTKDKDQYSVPFARVGTPQ